jgi:hypothetical protein
VSTFSATGDASSCLGVREAEVAADSLSTKDDVMKLVQLSPMISTLLMVGTLSTISTGCGFVKVQGLPGSNQGGTNTTGAQGESQQPQSQSKGEAFDPEKARVERAKREKEAADKEAAEKRENGIKSATRAAEERVAYLEKQVEKIEKGEEVDMEEAVIGFPSPIDQKAHLRGYFERDAPGVQPSEELYKRLDALPARHLAAVNAAAAKRKPTPRNGADPAAEKEMHINCGLADPKTDAEKAFAQACKNLKGKDRVVITSGPAWKINDRGNRYREGVTSWNVPGTNVCFEVASDAGNKLVGVMLYATEYFHDYAFKGHYTSCK